MSSTSIHDEGYTPSDFLEKLFRRDSASSSQHSFEMISSYKTTSYNYNSTRNLFQSSPIIPAPSPSKIIRAHSLVEEDRISTKKFRLFFKTITEGLYTQEEAQAIWVRFESSLTNPFEFDRFIEQIRQKAEKRRTPQPQPLVLADLNLPPLPPRAATAPKNGRAHQRVTASVGKSVDRGWGRKMLEKEARHLRKIIGHGEKFIQAK